VGVRVFYLIEEAMGNRQGERTELKQHVAEVDKGQTRDIAAAAVGKGLKIENGRFLIFAKSKTGKELAKVI